MSLWYKVRPKTTDWEELELYPDISLIVMTVIHNTLLSIVPYADQSCLILIKFAIWTKMKKLY